MAWNWNNGPRGYNNGPRGWNNGPQRYPQNYGPQQGPGPDMGQQPQWKFNIGEKVIHSATGTELFIIAYGREQYQCRKPDLSSEYFYEHELEPASK